MLLKAVFRISVIRGSTTELNRSVLLRGLNSSFAKSVAYETGQLAISFTGRLSQTLSNWSRTYCGSLEA